MAGGQARTFTYDAAGNITYDNRSGTGFSYGYNAKNRMESVSINGVVQSEFAYNALGQQVIRRLTVGGQTIHSVHDADGNRVAEYNYDPGTQISTLLREYVWMNGENVAVVEGGVVYYVRTDHIGRPVFVTDDSGAKVWEASYLPFGGVHTSTGPNSDLRFPGQWFQSEAGLHQNWMRDYDPTTGRYIQADPLGLIDGASVYGYVRQNPMRYTDPRGESWRDLFDYLPELRSPYSPPPPPANDNFPPSEGAEQCEEPEMQRCNLIRELDELGQRQLGLGGEFPNGKLCVYDCDNRYGKIELFSKFGTCRTPVLEIETNPIRPEDLGKLGLY